MQKIKVRAMTPEDVAAVAVLEQSAFSEPWSESGFLSALSQENSIFLVAVADDSVIGYCGFYAAADEGDITNVATENCYRRRGIGTALVEAVKSAAGQRGVREIFLEVRESNQAAQNLYRGTGFEFCGRRKNFYRRPTEDALLMVCKL